MAGDRIMRTLITDVIPNEGGIDNRIEYDLPSSIEWELRFYCNCGEELAEDDIIAHTSECSEGVLT